MRFFNIRREKETIYKTVLDLLIRSLSGIDSWQNKIVKKNSGDPATFNIWISSQNRNGKYKELYWCWLSKNRGIKHGKIIFNVNKKFRWQKTEKELLQFEYV